MVRDFKNCLSKQLSAGRRSRRRYDQCGMILDAFRTTILYVQSFKNLLDVFSKSRSKLFKNIILRPSEAWSSGPLAAILVLRDVH